MEIGAAVIVHCHVGPHTCRDRCYIGHKVRPEVMNAYPVAKITIVANGHLLAAYPKITPGGDPAVSGLCRSDLHPAFECKIAIAGRQAGGWEAYKIVHTVQAKRLSCGGRSRDHK